MAPPADTDPSLRWFTRWPTFFGELCGSGRELAQQGYTHDVTIAAEVNTSTVVPVLKDGQFTDATYSG